MQTEILNELLRSKAFREWRKPNPKSFQYTSKVYRNQIGEKHWTPADVAEEWGVSPDLVRDLFKDEDGVLIVERPGNRTKRAYSTIRIPESVLTRVYNQLSRR